MQTVLVGWPWVTLQLCVGAEVPWPRGWAAPGTQTAAKATWSCTGSAASPGVTSPSQKKKKKISIGTCLKTQLKKAAWLAAIFSSGRNKGEGRGSFIVKYKPNIWELANSSQMFLPQLYHSPESAVQVTLFIRDHSSFTCWGDLRLKSDQDLETLNVFFPQKIPVHYTWHL